MDGSIYRSPDIFSGCEGMFLKKKAAIAAFFMGENDLKISEKLLDPFLNHE